MQWGNNIGVLSARSRVSLFSNFTDFINKLEKKIDISNLINLDKIITKDGDAEDIKKFLTMVQDPLKTAVSGSAVLAARLGRTDFGSDIDIFMEDNTSGNALAFIRYFFEEGAGKPYMDCFGLDAVDSFYPFKINSLYLKTLRAKLSDETVLNFIFVYKQYPNLNEEIFKELFRTQNRNANLRRGLIRNLTNSTHVRYNHILNDLPFKFPDNTSENTSNNPIDINGTGLVLSHIFSSFGFEELKYVWNFDTNEVKSIFNQQRYCLEYLKNKLRRFDSENDNSNPFFDQRVESVFNNLDEVLQKQNLNFNTEFNKAQTMTISEIPNVSQISFQSPTQFNRMEVDTYDFNFLKFMQSLNARIEKYEQYGFKIKDPRGEIIKLNFKLQNIFLSALFDENFIKTMRTSLLGQNNPDILLQYKSLREIQKLLEEERKKMSILYESREREVQREVQRSITELIGSL